MTGHTANVFLFQFTLLGSLLFFGFWAKGLPLSSRWSGIICCVVRYGVLVDCRWLFVGFVLRGFSHGTAAFLSPCIWLPWRNVLGRYNQQCLLWRSLGLLCIGILQLVINTSWSHSPDGWRIPLCKPTDIVQIINYEPDSFKWTVTIMSDKILKNFPFIWKLSWRYCVIGGKCAHILTAVMSILRLFTLSRGSEYQLVIKLSNLNPSANYKHLTLQHL